MTINELNSLPEYVLLAQPSNQPAQIIHRAASQDRVVFQGGRVAAKRFLKTYAATVAAPIFNVKKTPRGAPSKVVQMIFGGAA